VLWREELAWACLGFILAVVGSSWLLMGLTAGRQSVVCERRNAALITTLERKCARRRHSSFIKVWRPWKKHPHGLQSSDLEATMPT
jgi:hypothetical protein